MTDTASSDRVAAARRYFEVSVERPERALADLPRVLSLLSTDDEPVVPERRLARREAASGALANLAKHDPAVLADTTPTLIAELRAELEWSCSGDERDRAARALAIREHLVTGLACILRANPIELTDPDDVGVVVDALSPELNDDAARTAMWALVAIAENYPERLAPAVESLATLLNHPDDTVAALCAGALGRLAEVRPRAVAENADELGKLLGHDDEVVQHNAVEALAAVARRRSGAVAPLAEQLRGVLDHGSVAIQHNATGVLCVLAEDHPTVVRPAVDDIRALRDHDDAPVRRVAAGTLARLGEADPG